MVKLFSCFAHTVIFHSTPISRIFPLTNSNWDSKSYPAMATTVSVSYICERHNEALADTINRTARWLSPLLMVIVAGYAFYW